MILDASLIEWYTMKSNCSSSPQMWSWREVFIYTFHVLSRHRFKKGLLKNLYWCAITIEALVLLHSRSESVCKDAQIAFADGMFQEHRLPLWCSLSFLPRQRRGGVVDVSAYRDTVLRSLFRLLEG